MARKRKSRPPSPPDALSAHRELRTPPRLRAELEKLKQAADHPVVRRSRELLRLADVADHPVVRISRELSRLADAAAAAPAPKKVKRNKVGRPRDLDEEQVARGVKYVNDNPELTFTFKKACPLLRKHLGTKTSDSTLRRRVWSKRKRER